MTPVIITIAHQRKSLRSVPNGLHQAVKMVSYIQPSEIPSLSFLYHLKKLHAAPDNAKLPVTLSGPNTTPPASKERNDRVSIMRSNITVLAVDAIVNAANSSLLGGGGVDGAIHAAAGPGLLAECRLAGGCQTGFVKITNAYMLPCQKVIHAVGPVYYEAIGDLCENQLSNCYTRALRVAEDAGCRSVAFSAISTGVYGYPSKLAAPVAIAAVRSYLDKHSKGVLEKVVFVTFMEKDFNAYMEFLP